MKFANPQGFTERFTGVLERQLSFRVLLFLGPILEENACRLKTSRRFCLTLRCCDAPM